jgi:hypothetical protein
VPVQTSPSYIDGGFVAPGASATLDVIDPSTYVEAPWGGDKQSGIGRELGTWGVEEYRNVKQVHINVSEQPIGWY